MRAGWRIIRSAVRMQRLLHVVGDAGADLADEPDLALALGALARPAVGLAVLGDAELAVGARQPREQRPVELLRQRVQLHRLARPSPARVRAASAPSSGRSARDRRRGGRNRALPYRSVWKNSDRIGVAGLRREILVGHPQPAPLPRRDTLQRAGEDRVRVALRVQARDVRKLLRQHRLRRTGRIAVMRWRCPFFSGATRGRADAAAQSSRDSSALDTRARRRGAGD